jgi:hypothetical protein
MRTQRGHLVLVLNIGIGIRLRICIGRGICGVGLDRGLIGRRLPMRARVSDDAVRRQREGRGATNVRATITIATTLTRTHTHMMTSIASMHVCL